MTNQAIESTTNALAPFVISAPEVDAAQAIARAPASIGADNVARSTIARVALADSGYPVVRNKFDRDAEEDSAPNGVRNVLPGGATALDTRLDDRTIPARRDGDSGRRRYPAEYGVAGHPGEPEPSNADVGYALDDIVRFEGKIITSHRDDMRDEAWPLSAHS